MAQWCEFDMKPFCYKNGWWDWTGHCAKVCALKDWFRRFFGANYYCIVQDPNGLPGQAMTCRLDEDCTFRGTFNCLCASRCSNVDDNWLAQYS